jgi:hypothetical protein
MSDGDSLIEEEKDRDFSQEFDGQTLERDGPQKTEGSSGHPEQCVPCSFYCYSMSGCVKGQSCTYCHLQHVRQGHRRRRQRKAKNAVTEKGTAIQDDDPESPKKIVMPQEAELKRADADPEMPRKIALGGKEMKPKSHGLDACAWNNSRGAQAVNVPPPGLLLQTVSHASADGGYAAWPGMVDEKIKPPIETVIPPPGLMLLPQAHTEVNQALAAPPGLLLPQSNTSLEDNQRALLKLITHCSLLVQARTQSA